MKVFLSYTVFDAPCVQFLRGAMESPLGLEFFVLPDDAPPGSPWIDRIKLGVNNCDELYSIVTPESLARPWISAEWACFWMQNKPTTPLLIEVRVDQLWEPMRAFQSVDLLDVSSVTRFLRSVADRTEHEPVAGVTPLANEIVKEIPQVRRRQTLRSLERSIERLQRNIVGGTANVDPQDVRVFMAHDRLHDLISIATSSLAVDVKQRQVSICLVELGRFGDAARIGENMHNRNEISAICKGIVRMIPRGATESSDEWLALERLYSKLGKPQRRDVLEVMDQSGIAPLGSWAPGVG